MTPTAIKRALKAIDFLEVESPVKGKRVTSIFRKGNLTAKIQDYPERERKYIFFEAKIGELILKIDHIPIPENVEQLTSKANAFINLAEYLKTLPIHDYRYK